MVTNEPVPLLIDVYEAATGGLLGTEMDVRCSCTDNLIHPYPHEGSDND